MQAFDILPAFFFVAFRVTLRGGWEHFSDDLLAILAVQASRFSDIVFYWCFCFRKIYFDEVWGHLFGLLIEQDRGQASLVRL